MVPVVCVQSIPIVFVLPTFTNRWPLRVILLRQQLKSLISAWCYSTVYWLLWFWSGPCGYWDLQAMRCLPLLLACLASPSGCWTTGQDHVQCPGHLSRSPFGEVFWDSPIFNLIVYFPPRYFQTVCIAVLWLCLYLPWVHLRSSIYVHSSLLILPLKSHKRMEMSFSEHLSRLFWIRS